MAFPRHSPEWTVRPQHRCLGLGGRNVGNTDKVEFQSLIRLTEKTFIRAQQPFPDVDPFEMEGYLVDGFRLHQPVNCPDQLYTVNCLFLPIVFNLWKGIYLKKKTSRCRWWFPVGQQGHSTGQRFQLFILIWSSSALSSSSLSERSRSSLNQDPAFLARLNPDLISWFYIVHHNLF